MYKLNILIFSVFFMAHSISYAMDSYTDIGVDFNIGYNQKSSQLNPNNIFEFEDGFSTKESLYYKKSIYKNDISFDIVNFLEYYNNEGKINNKILELYGSTELYGNFFDIGKKKSPMGVSVFKNILDSDKTLKENERDLKYKEGKIQLNYEIFTDKGVLGFTYYPKTNFNKNTVEKLSSNQNEEFKARFTGYKDNYEYAILGIKNNGYKFGGNLATRINNNLEFYVEGAYLEKNNIYDIKKENINTDLFKIIGLESSKKDSIKLIIGNNISRGKFSFRSEYFYNKDGFNKNQWDKRLKILEETRRAYDKKDINLNKSNLGEGLNMISNNGIGNLGKHYFMTRGSMDEIYNMDISGITILNLQDLSGMVIFSVNYIMKDIINLELEPRFSFGNEYSEYKLMGEDYNVSLNIGWDY
ncbi:MAG: hypothetical protein ACQERZ_04695 [Fusobacteriota bacterium]